MATEEGMKTALVYSEEWRRFDYGPEHPLRMERLGLTWRLMEAYGLTAGPKLKVLTPEPASLEAITRFHTPEYVEVLRDLLAHFQPKAEAGDIYIGTLIVPAGLFFF